MKKLLETQLVSSGQAAGVKPEQQLHRDTMSGPHGYYDNNSEEMVELDITRQHHHANGFDSPERLSLRSPMPRRPDASGDSFLSDKWPPTPGRFGGDSIPGTPGESRSGTPLSVRAVIPIC